MRMEGDADYGDIANQGKVQIACEYCRHRRIRCDGNFPCGSCAARGKSCFFPTEPPKKRGPKPKRVREAGDHDAPEPSPSTSLSSSRPYHDGQAKRARRPSGPAPGQSSAPGGGILPPLPVLSPSAPRAPVRSTVSARPNGAKGKEKAIEKGKSAVGVDKPRPGRVVPLGSWAGVPLPAPSTRWEGYPFAGGEDGEEDGAGMGSLRAYKAPQLQPLVLVHPRGLPVAHRNTPYPTFLGVGVSGAGSGGIPLNVVTGRNVGGGRPSPALGPAGAPMPVSVSRAAPDPISYPQPSEREWQAIQAYFDHSSAHLPGMVSKGELHGTLAMWTSGVSAGGLAGRHPMPTHWWTAHTSMRSVGAGAAAVHEEGEGQTVHPNTCTGGGDDVSRLPPVERAQVAQYYAVCAVGYRIHATEEEFAVADTYFERSRALALSSVDDPTRPLVSALALLAYYSLGMQRRVAASIQASLAWRLARACGLTVDDGGLGSAVRLIRQIVCLDLEPLPLSERIIPLPPKSGRGGGGAETSPTPSAIDATARGGKGVMQGNGSVSASDSDTPTPTPTPVTAEDSFRAPGYGHSEGPLSSITALWQPAQSPAVIGFGPYLPVTAHASAAIQGTHAGREWGKEMQEAAAVGGAGSSFPVACVACGALRVLPARREATLESTLSASYIDMRSQELMGYVVSRLMAVFYGIVKGPSAYSLKREVRRLADEMVCLAETYAPRVGLHFSASRCASIYGVRAILCWQNHKLEMGECWARRAIEQWALVDEAHVSHSFLMLFIAHFVALISLNAELRDSASRIVARLERGASGVSSGAAVEALDEDGYQRVEEEELDGDGSASRHLPPLHSFKGFFTCATLLKRMGAHWPLAALINDTCMSEARAMHGAVEATAAQWSTAGGGAGGAAAREEPGAGERGVGADPPPPSPVHGVVEDMHETRQGVVNVLRDEGGGQEGGGEDSDEDGEGVRCDFLASSSSREDTPNPIPFPRRLPQTGPTALQGTTDPSHSSSTTGSALDAGHFWHSTTALSIPPPPSSPSPAPLLLLPRPGSLSHSLSLLPVEALNLLIEAMEEPDRGRQGQGEGTQTAPSAVSSTSAGAHLPLPHPVRTHAGPLSHARGHIKDTLAVADAEVRDHHHVSHGFTHGHSAHVHPPLFHGPGSGKLEYHLTDIHTIREGQGYSGGRPSPAAAPVPAQHVSSRQPHGLHLRSPSDMPEERGVGGGDYSYSASPMPRQARDDVGLRVGIPGRDRESLNRSSSAGPGMVGGGGYFSEHMSMGHDDGEGGSVLVRGSSFSSVVSRAGAPIGRGSQGGPVTPSTLSLGFGLGENGLGHGLTGLGGPFIFPSSLGPAPLSGVDTPSAISLGPAAPYGYGS